MTPGADVRSIDGLREWLAAMTGYKSVIADSLAGFQMEIRRGIDWVGEQLSQWQRAVREAEEEVTQAKAELAARKFPNWDGKMPDTTLQERNLRRAKAWLEHCEDKVRACRSWQARLPKLVEEAYSGPGHRLATMLDVEVTRGLAVLDRRLDALERYADLKKDYSSGPSVLPPAGPTGGAS
jgi:multidrug resistance efflux pump